MKSVPTSFLLAVLAGAASPAGAQGVSKCFRADWLQGERVVNFRVDGNRVAGTFAVGGDDESRRGATYEFAGTLEGDTLTVAFAGGKLPLYYLCQDVHGSAGNDALYGSAGWDCLSGQAGDDVAFGGPDDDGLIGGDNDDQLSGGPGDDSGLGGRGDDRIRLGRGEDTGYGGVGADIVSGGPGDDKLFGLKYLSRGDEPRPSDHGGNVLRGQTGADRLDGGPGEGNRNLGGTGFDLCRNPTKGQGSLGCERVW